MRAISSYSAIFLWNFYFYERVFYKFFSHFQLTSLTPKTNWITLIYIVKSLVIAVKCPPINLNYEAKIFNMNIAKIIMFIAIEMTQNQGGWQY